MTEASSAKPEEIVGVLNDGVDKGISKFIEAAVEGAGDVKATLNPLDGQSAHVSGWIPAVSLHVCKYYVTICLVLLWVADRRSLVELVVCLGIGVGVDVARRFICPEFRLPAEQRRDSFLRAVVDDDFARKMRRKYLVRAGWVIPAWWIYLAAFMLIPAFRGPSMITQNPVLSLLMRGCAEVYPPIGEFISAFGSPTQNAGVFAVIQFLCVSWWLMVLGVMLEASGGAFLNQHYMWFRWRKAKLAGRKAKDRSQVRLLVGVGMLVWFYTTSSFVLTQDDTFPAALVAQDYNFKHTVYIMGLALITCSYVLGILYQIFMANASFMINFGDKIDREKYDSLSKIYNANLKEKNDGIIFHQT